MRCRLILLLLLQSVMSVAAEMDTRTGINDPAFCSLQVEVEGIPLSTPIITLGGNDRVVVSFDELADERRYMRYELIHCDASWRPEGLVDSEFLDGFNQGDVNDYAFSEATLVHYVHYRIVLPNEQVRFTASGNYLLRVYPEDNPDETLLQARFMVDERAVSIAGDVTTRTDIDTNDAHQQLELAVSVGDYPVEDLYNDLKVVIEQDGRQDNAVTISQPLRLNGRTAIFEHQRPLIFEAGNEYRRFEIISTSYPGMGVESIDYQAPVYNMNLYVDTPRAGGMYQYDQTQHGRYLVREFNSVDSDVQADYVLTHFALEMPEQPGVAVYIDGDLVNRRLDPTSLMRYNHATGRYERSLLLKQGAYNYQYLVMGPGETAGSAGAIEGNYYQTVHEYTVRVYHRPRGTRYDRLVGSTIITNLR